MELLERFIREKCIVDARLAIEVMVLYNSLKDYLKEYSLSPIPVNDFKQEMQKRFHRGRKGIDQTYKGICLLRMLDPQSQDKIKRDHNSQPNLIASGIYGEPRTASGFDLDDIIYLRVIILEMIHTYPICNQNEQHDATYENIITRQLPEYDHFGENVQRYYSLCDWLKQDLILCAEYIKIAIAGPHRQSMVRRYMVVSFYLSELMEYNDRVEKLKRQGAPLLLK
jgi:hypothetical protein